MDQKRQRIKKKLRHFLFSKANGNIMLFLVFLGISAGFWLLQTLNEVYETEFSIPLQLKNVPEDVVITTNLPDHLRISVKDKGTVLFKYMFGQSFLPIKIDFKQSSNDDGHVVLRSADLQKFITPQLASSTKLTAIKPDTLEYYYNLGESKTVPVRLRGKVIPSQQYYISRIAFSPDSVKVYATEDVLNKIDAAYTEPAYYSNVSDTMRFATHIDNVRGAKFMPAVIRCAICTDIYTEKTVSVPVVGVNFPADKRLRTFPSQVNITFRVGLSRFRSINSDDFVLSVTYAELLQSGSSKCHLRLKSIPAGASKVRIVPSDVDYLIEQIPESADD